MSKNKLVFIGFTIITTLLVCLINVQCSPDYELYRFIWNSLDCLDYSEVLWSLLNILSKFFFFDYNLFLFFISLFTVYFKFKYLKDLVKSNVVLIFYSSSFLILHESIQIRLAFGLVFVLKSILYSLENKQNKCWIFLTLASLIHLSLVFFVIVKLLSVVLKNRLLQVLFLVFCVFLFEFISQKEYIILMIDFLSEFKVDWSQKLSKYLYEFLELESLKSFPLQLYFVGFVYLFDLILNFQKRNTELNQTMLLSFVWIIPVLMIPNDTISSRLIELCFFFLPIVQFKIFKELRNQKYKRLSYALLFLFFILNIKIFTNQLI